MSNLLRGRDEPREEEGGGGRRKMRSRARRWEICRGRGERGVRRRTGMVELDSYERCQNVVSVPGLRVAA